MFPAAVQAKVQRNGVGAPNAPRPWVAPTSVRAPAAPVRKGLCHVAQDDATAPAAEAAATPVAASTNKIPVADLVPGEAYEGTVLTGHNTAVIPSTVQKSVAAYGAFVDIGSTTDGLVHISQIAHGYVKDVNDHISAGQKVNVVLLSVEGDTKLSLSIKAGMPETEADKEQRQQRENKSGGGQRAPRRGRNPVAPQHSLEVGQEVSGTVSKVVGFGAFVKLEDGFEVLLPTSEMSGAADELDPNPHSLVSENAAITGTVIKVDRNKVAMTNMKKSERESIDAASAEKVEASVVLGGSLMADITGLDNSSLQAMVAALPATKRDAAPAEAVEEAEAAAMPEVEAAEAVTAAPEAVSQAEEEAAAAAAKAEEEAAATAAAEAAAKAEAEAAAEAAAKAEEEAAAAAAAKAEEEAAAAAAAEAAAKAEQAPTAAAEEAPVEAAPTPDAAPAAADPAPAPVTEGVAVSAALVKELRGISGAGMMDCKTALKKSGGDMEAAKEFLRKKGLASADQKASRIAAEGAIVSYIHAGSRLGVIAEVNCETDFVARGDTFKEFAGDVAMQVAACPDVQVVSPDDVPEEFIAKEREIEMGKQDLLEKPEQIREKIVEGRLNKLKAEQALMSQAYIRSEKNETLETIVKQKIAEVGEKISVRRFVRYNLGEGLQKKTEDFAAEVAAQTEAKASSPEAPKEEKPKEEVPDIKVDAKLVKELRGSSGAGMMDCKQALKMCNNNLEEAEVWLKKKGLASASKKAGRLAAEGVVETYIHAGAGVGSLIEVNCETDFVAKGETFKELATDLAMQVVANPDVQYVSPDDVPQAFKDAEMEMESKREDLEGKPEKAKSSIISGRVNKTINKMCLLHQDFIRSPEKTVETVVKEAIAATGENIKVRRFTRFTLGEGLEKRSDDFAAEVAAQTGQS